MTATPVPFEMTVFLVVLALAFDFMNGFHDAANSIATVVSTRVLRPHYAVAWAAFFNFVAFLVFGLSVANTIGKGVIDAHIVDIYVILGALVGAIIWNVITWWYGLPSSSSHALIGGLAGAAVAKGGVAGAGRQRFPQDQPRDRALADAGPGARHAADDRRRLGLLSDVAAPGRSLVPPAAARLGVALQPGPRRQRRAEDDGHHRADAGCPRFAARGFRRLRDPVLGRARMPGGDRARHARPAAGGSSRPWARRSPS